MTEDGQVANLRDAMAEVVKAADPPTVQLDIIERTAGLPITAAQIAGEYDEDDDD